jgi:hypothetical protein
MEQLSEAALGLAVQGRTMFDGIPKPLDLALFTEEFEDGVAGWVPPAPGCSASCSRRWRGSQSAAVAARRIGRCRRRSALGSDLAADAVATLLERELTELGAALSDTQEGRGRVVLVEAPASFPKAGRLAASPTTRRQERRRPLRIVWPRSVFAGLSP